MKVAIIGAGLAGTALAYVLKKAGAEPVIYEASGSIASGASGNDVGLYNPRFTADKCPEQEFYSTAFFKALDVFKSLEGIDWNPCGALHLVTDEKKAKRFPKTVQSWGWGADSMRMLSAQEASEVAGIEITKECLYLPQSGIVSPRKLCAAYASGVDVHLNTNIHDLSLIEADVIVLACGVKCLEFQEASNIPLKSVRGQVSYFTQTEISQNLRCTVGYGGYVAPALSGIHCVGSTFQPWLDHSEILAKDDQDNLDNLHKNLPAFQDVQELISNRAAVRTTTKDHFPMVGQISENLYISTAHGSHGIISSLMGAYILSSMLLKKNNILSPEVMFSLKPDRC